ncbi:hypothetical protein [Bowmanella pacifica]|uniref:Sugar efflux transporter for intercellular exchange n=1 Tax=Bowmanella pacifica TaxID=502051 RepID=A0A918DIK1_9ALTE|nr:hypothetical protein [Bowmanella pacifica]GGO68103.1 hypothetical protein GCM10010982_16240 [Bowmanella pacifica]
METISPVVRQEKYWDMAGILIGLMGCLAQLTQVISEWQRSDPGNMSLAFVIGYWLVFAFWLAYGLFFKRPAIIVTNSIALLLQSALLIAQF